MPTDAVHQVEFRWQRATDFAPIALSSDDSRISEIAKRLAALAAPPKGAVDGHRSVVYLVMPEYRTAAIIERFFDRRALPIQADHHEDGGRHPQVARALVGDPAAVDLDLALACEHQSPFWGSGQPEPGQVRPGQPLLPYDPIDLGEFAKQALDQTNRPAAHPAGLPTLVAAVLRRPDRPISVLAPESLLQGEGAVQGVCLRVLRDTVGLLLTGTGSGWIPSFSTYEPFPRETSIAVPRLIFRGPPRETAYSMQARDETVIRLQDAPEADRDHFDAVARCLLAAYGELGRNRLAALLEPIITRHMSVAERVDAVLRDPGLKRYRDVPDRPQTSPPLPPLPPFPPPVPPSPQPVTETTEYLKALYDELDAQRGTAGFFEILTWISAAVHRRITLSAPDARPIVQKLAERRWYLETLRERRPDDTGKLLAVLAFPLLAEQSDDDKTGRYLARLIDQPDPAGAAWAQAAPLLYAWATDDQAAASLARHLLPAQRARARRAAENQTAPWWAQRVRLPLWLVAAAGFMIAFLAVLLLGG